MKSKEIRKLMLKINPPPHCPTRIEDRCEDVKCCYFCAFLQSCEEKVRKLGMGIKCPFSRGAYRVNFCDEIRERIKEEERNAKRTS